MPETITITLTSTTPVTLPGGEIPLTATVTSDEAGPVNGAQVKWTVYPDNTGAAFTSASPTAGDSNGISTNTLKCSQAEALTVTVSYVGDPAVTATLDVGFSSTNLTTPIVPQATNGMIDAKTLVDAVQAMVVAHTGDAQVGDIYHFYWGTTTQVLSRIYTGASKNFPWIIDVGASLGNATAFSDGAYEVYYTITDTAGNLRYSPPLMITVEGGTYGAEYDPPIFPNITNNTLNYNEMINDSGLVIKIPYPQTSSIVASSVISVYMKITYTGGEIIKDSELVATYTVSKDDITALLIEVLIAQKFVSDNKDTFDGVRGVFYYTVQNDSKLGTSYSKSIIIDTVPPHLSR